MLMGKKEGGAVGLPSVSVRIKLMIIRVDVRGCQSIEPPKCLVPQNVSCSAGCETIPEGACCLCFGKRSRLAADK